MQIPEKIKIGGYMVTVEFVEHLMTDRQHTGEYKGSHTPTKTAEYAFCRAGLRRESSSVDRLR